MGGLRPHREPSLRSAAAEGGGRHAPLGGKVSPPGSAGILPTPCGPAQCRRQACSKGTIPLAPGYGTRLKSAPVGTANSGGPVAAASRCGQEVDTHSLSNTFRTPLEWAATASRLDGV